MEKTYNIVYRVFLLPIIVAFMTTLSIQFIDRNRESELIGFTMFDNLVIVGMLFLSIYMLIMVFVVTIDFYLFKKVKNKMISFLLLNIIGFLLIGCIDGWLLKYMELKSLYVVFPLFSLLSLVPLDSNAN